MKYKELSKLIIETRKQQGMSQRDLSELAGVGTTVIYKIESGRDDVTLSSFVSVLMALGIELSCKSPLGDEVSLNG